MTGTTPKPVVMKFGGTSVTGALALKRLADLTARELDGGVLVVVSAMTGVTDRLTQLADQVLSGNMLEAKRMTADLRMFHQDQARALDPAGSRLSRDLDDLMDQLEAVVAGSSHYEAKPLGDLILSFGERLSVLTAGHALRARIHSVEVVPAWRLIATDENHGQANLLPQVTLKNLEHRVRPHLKPGRVLLTQGFLGFSREGNITTLGRGGSDYTATLLAGLLQVRKVWIWSDVNGVLTADPKQVDQPRPIPHMTQREADHLARLGAKVLHPRSIKALNHGKIPLHVANSFNPNHHGTCIHPHMPEDRAVFAVAGRGARFQIERNTVGDPVAARLLDPWFPELRVKADPLFRPISENGSHPETSALALLGALCPPTHRPAFMERLAQGCAQAQIPVLFTAWRDPNHPCFLVTHDPHRQRITTLMHQLGVPRNPHQPPDSFGFADRKPVGV